jgi:hypothetical protein
MPFDWWSAGLYFGPKSLNPTPTIKKESNYPQSIAIVFFTISI